MKSIILTIVFLVSIDINSQSIIGTYDISKNRLGIHAQTEKFDLNPYVSFEKGNEIYEEGSHYKTNKYCIGGSLNIYDLTDKYTVNAGICYNQTEAPVKKISFEVGFPVHIKSAVILIMCDPLNKDYKIGFGYTFKKL